MVRLPEEAAATRDAFYNWHKSIGLVALAVALLRVWARRVGELPPWAPCLTEHERRMVHRAEQGLYLAIFTMPVTGLLHVMAGGYGVRFAGAFDLPNPFPRWEWLAAVGAWGMWPGGAAVRGTRRASGRGGAPFPREAERFDPADAAGRVRLRPASRNRPAGAPPRCRDASR